MRVGRLMSGQIAALILLLAVLAVYGGSPSLVGVLAWALLVLVVAYPISVVRDTFHPFMINGVFMALAALDFLGKDSGQGILRYAPHLSIETTAALRSEALVIMLTWNVLFYASFWITSAWPRCTPPSKTTAHLVIRQSGAWGIALTVLAWLAWSAVAFYVAGSVEGMFAAMGRRTQFYAGLNYLRYFVQLGSLGAILLLARGWRIPSAIVAVVTAGAVALFGGRGAAVSGVLLPYLIAYSHLHRRIGIGKASIIGFLSLIFVLVWGELRRFGYVRDGLELVSWLWELGNYSGMADTLPSLLWAMKTGMVAYQFGRPMLGILVAPLPRTLWAAKPEAIDESAVVGQMLIGENYWGLPPGPYGWGYLNFGWLGVMVGAIVTGSIVARVYGGIARGSTSTHQGTSAFLWRTVLYATTITAWLNIITVSGQIHVVWWSLVLLGIGSFESVVSRTSIGHAFDRRGERFRRDLA